MFLMLKYALLSATVLMLVALGGCFSEHSGVINLALEGIMVIGGLVGTMALPRSGSSGDLKGCCLPDKNLEAAMVSRFFFAQKQKFSLIFSLAV